MVRDGGVLDALGDLLQFDPAVADRTEIGSMIGRANHVLGWVQAANVRLARRLRELEAAGEAESASSALMDEGRRSGREAKATEQREELCTEFPALEDALANGACSTDHLDALSRLTKNLTDAERSDLHAVADDIIGSATTDWVSEFERKTRNIVDKIKEIHSPGNDVAELERQRDASKMSRWVEKTTGMCKTLIELDPIRDAEFHSAHQAQLARLRSENDQAGVPFAQLQVEAFMASVSTATPAHRTAGVTMHIDLSSACHGRHDATLCELADGTPIPVSTAQRLCCEATIALVAIDDNGQALAVGREFRTATRAQRRALEAMYSTCSHPHCEVAVDRCRVHHITFWRHGGRSDLDNLIPVCERHHHLVHEGGWQLTMTADRRCTWIQPDGTIWHEGQGVNRQRDRSSDPPRHHAA